MAKNYLYIIDPITHINPKTDTTFVFMLESQHRGVNNYYCQLQDIMWNNNKTQVNAHAVRVFSPDEQQKFYELGGQKIFDLDYFCVVWMRKDPPVDNEYLVACMLLDYHDPQKTLLMNNPRGLRIANEKLWAMNFAHIMPDTFVSSSIKLLKDKCKEFSRVVLKPIFGAAGAGILVFDYGDRNLPSALELLSAAGTKPICVQKFIPEIRAGDKRVLLLGGEPIGAVLRVPHNGEHRANLHVGGQAQKAPLSPEDMQIAAQIKPKLLELGLHFVGIDIIGGKLTEVNVTSPTGAQEIDILESREGKDRIAALVMDYVDHNFSIAKKVKVI